MSFGPIWSKLNMAKCGIMWPNKLKIGLFGLNLVLFGPTLPNLIPKRTNLTNFD